MTTLGTLSKDGGKLHAVKIPNVKGLKENRFAGKILAF